MKTLTEDEKGILAMEIIKTWKADSKIRAEFDQDFTAYSAFCEANALGKVGIIGGKVSKFSKESFSDS